MLILGDAPVSAGATESNDNDKYQIDFLNSVIVDQQKKIDELNKKIQVLAEVGDVGHNGYELEYRYGIWMLKR